MMLKWHLALVQGHALYYGRAQMADDYFQKMGYNLPYRVNVADFILDLASGDVSVDDRCARACFSFTALLRKPTEVQPSIIVPDLDIACVWCCVLHALAVSASFTLVKSWQALQCRTV
jgi:hypothetical protein